MLRGKRLVVLAHCILNQNSVVRGWARARGSFSNVVKGFLDREVGIFQLPCPEFTYLGEARPPMTREEYDTPEYRAHCRHLLEPVAKQLGEYVSNGYEIIGVVGIEESPSCDVLGRRGVFMEVLLDLLGTRGFRVPLHEVPVDYGQDEEADWQFPVSLRRLLEPRP